jgi:predicted nuclease with TOPRIM domain
VWHLQDDFRSLFQANEKLKTDYRVLQEEYKKVRSEASKLKLNLTELQGELATRNEKITTLELEISKLSNRCEVCILILCFRDELFIILINFVGFFLDVGAYK